MSGERCEGSAGGAESPTWAQPLAPDLLQLSGVRGLVEARALAVRQHVYDRVRRQAGEVHWAPVGAWDDDTIDDPAAFPDWTGRCGTSEGPAAHYRIKTPVCQPCRDARAVHRSQPRRRPAAA